MSRRRHVILRFDAVYKTAIDFYRINNSKIRTHLSTIPIYFATQFPPSAVIFVFRQLHVKYPFTVISTESLATFFRVERWRGAGNPQPVTYVEDEKQFILISRPQGDQKKRQVCEMKKNSITAPRRTSGVVTTGCVCVYRKLHIFRLRLRTFPASIKPHSFYLRNSPTFARR